MCVCVCVYVCIYMCVFVCICVLNTSLYFFDHKMCVYLYIIYGLGGYRAMNRLGIKHNPSPLLKMSFETTYDFLRSACSSGDCDTLQVCGVYSYLYFCK